MKIKILEFKVYQGNICKVQSHNFVKGKWKKNPKFKMYQDLIIQSPHRFVWHKKYSKEVKDGTI